VARPDDESASGTSDLAEGGKVAPAPPIPTLDDSDFDEAPASRIVSPLDGDSIDLLEEDALLQTGDTSSSAAIPAGLRPRAASVPPPSPAGDADAPLAAAPPMPRAGSVPPPLRAATVPPPFDQPPRSTQPVAPVAVLAPSTVELDAALAEARANDWAARAEALRLELEAERDKARAGFLAYELGELTYRRLRDEAASVKLYGRALQSDPSFRPNLWAIRRVFYRRALWPNLIKLLDAEVRFARDDHERSDLLVEKGHVLEDKLKDRAAARDAYDRAIALDGEHVGALLARERLALTDQDDKTLERLWRALADASGSPARRVAYLCDLAGLFAAREGEAGVATALEIVSEAVALGVDRARVSRLRERLAERADDAEALLSALEARVALAIEAFGPGGVPPASADLPDGGTVTNDRAARLRQEIVACRRRGAHVAAGSGDPARAWKLLEHAATLAPGEPLLLMDLANLAEETSRHTELAALCAKLAALDADPGRQLALALRRADALLRAGREDEAEALLDQTLASAPGYLPVVELRKRRAMAAGEGGAAFLASLYEGEAAAARLGTAFGPGAPGVPDPEWAAGAYVAAGDLYALRLGKAEEAQSAYGQALEVVPGYGPALWALVGLHERTGHIDAACELLEEQVERVDAPYLDDILEHLARLYDEQAQSEKALTALRRLAERRPEDRVLAWRVVDLLRDAGHAEARLEMLERLADTEPDPPRRAALQVEIARTADEELDRAEQAAERYKQALAADPDNRWAAAALAALLRRAGRWEDLVASLRTEAAAESDPARAARALREAASVLARRLHRPADAASLYHELAERAPDDPASLQGLVDALAADPERLLIALERLAAAQTPATGLGRTLLRLAELQETLGHDADAATTYARARAAGGIGAHADWALFQLAARGASELDAALAGLAEATSDDEVRADLQEELAWLSLAEQEQASARIDAVLEKHPARKSALLARALFAARRRDAGALARALAAQAEHLADPRAAAALYLRAATMSVSSEESAQLSARATELLPEDGAAALEASERPPAESMPVARRAALLARRAEGASDPALHTVLDLERADEAEAQGQLAEAGRIVAEVLARTPGHSGALATLVRLARRSGDDDTLARATYQLGKGLADPHSAAAYLAESARLLEGKLARPEDAARVWRALLERLPLDEEAFTHAHKLLLERDDDPTALHELLSHRLRHVDAPEEEVPHRAERASLRARRKDLAGAARDLERVLTIDARHPGALLALADVRLAEGRGKDATQLYQRFLATSPPAEAALDAQFRLARVLGDDLGDLAGAVRALEVVVAGRPDHLEARQRLATALEKLGEHARAAETLEHLGALRGDRDARARDELAAARLYQYQLHDAAKARRSLERARSLAPLDLEVVRELAQVVPESDRPRTLALALADVRAGFPDAGVDLDELGGLFGRAFAIAKLGSDAPLELTASGSLVALGVASEEQKLAWAQRVRAVVEKSAAPTGVIAGDMWRARLTHPGWQGPLAELWACLYDALAELGVHEPSQLGFARGDRQSTKATGRSYPFLNSWLRAVGGGDFDVYVADGRAGVAQSVSGETPTIFLGADVARGDGVLARARLGRTLAAARDRSGPLLEMSDDEVALTFAAAVRVGGADPARVPALAQAATSRALDERARTVGKALTRRGKKGLPAALARLGEVESLQPFLLAVRASAGRAALLAAGDVPATLEVATGDRRVTDVFRAPLALDLMVYAVSDDFLTLRRELGL
jgi:tetratricopeptide (TPR) repeat protein